MSSSRISILIPCYNAEQWIAKAIESALGQDYVNKEVVVLDDGSTDSSLDIIRGYKKYIRWENQSNQGGPAARNRLLELSKGEWIQYLDADDYLMPEKISIQVKFLADHPDTDVVFSPVLMEYHKGDSVTRELLPIPEPHDPWILMARWYLPQTGATLWRKEALLDVNGWKIGQAVCQEHELYLRLLIAGKTFRYCNVAGAVYRQWSEETICRKDVAKTFRNRLAIMQDLEKHLEATNQLCKERLIAINSARLEIARSEWTRDRALAKNIAYIVKDSVPWLNPVGPAFPPLYKLFYKIFGFEGAEKLAGCKRILRGLF